MEQVFFPLDEELGLLPGRLTPKQQENLAHLGSWMPFAKAAHLLERLVGVQVSESTVRRQTVHAGKMVQQEEDERSQQETKKEQPEASVPAQMAVSADGAFVPLVGGIWAEARTLAVATVVQTNQETRSTELSSFSRMTDATTFTSLCTGEMQQRHLFQAPAVADIMDGAEWLQGLLDVHRPDAVRILDFPHAAQRVSAIVEAAQHTGQQMAPDALKRSLHLLKHGGPRPVLRWLGYLTRKMASACKAHEDLTYLQKRESLMQYPQYQARGWPIGSGMVESANKLVVQARLKGSGMHWATPHVNPMLAWRSAVCSDRWDDAWQVATSRTRRQHHQQRVERIQQRQQQATTRFLLAWMRFLPPRRNDLTPPPAPPAVAKMVNGHPTAHHPWKRSFANLSAKI
ncbi:MAG TPA: ISKra4 family transposase [Ktedonobacteraceae bacterium]|nr:ISKra4 family transposase [Ktedonobacteraceae bacterium]